MDHAHHAGFARAGSETWPAGRPARGAGPWLTGSYDPETDTLYWGTGNPSPWRADVRPGANLFSDCVLALDPSTGKRKWYFQFTPNDEWDYDGVNENVLADITYKSNRVRALLHADRNGQFVVLDRVSGAFLYATPLVKSTAVLGYDARGNARIDPAARLRGNGPAHVCPSSIGGKNWWPSAYDPVLGRLYVPLSHMCMSMTKTTLEDRVGAPYLGVYSRLVPEPGSGGFGEVAALDVSTGARVWSTDDGFAVERWHARYGRQPRFQRLGPRAISRFRRPQRRRVMQREERSRGSSASRSRIASTGRKTSAVLAGWAAALRSSVVRRRRPPKTSRAGVAVRLTAYRNLGAGFFRHAGEAASAGIAPERSPAAAVCVFRKRCGSRSRMNCCSSCSQRGRAFGVPSS